MKQIKLLGYILINLLGISIFLILLINIKINYDQKKYIAQANNFLERFTPNISNANHLILDSYLFNLGLGKINKNNDSNQNNISSEVQDILTSLNDFFKEQIQVNSNDIKPIPSELQNFLREKKPEIVELRDFLLTINSLSWEYDFNNNFRDPLNYEMPHFINLISAQKILMLYVLSEYLQGNQEEINKTLEASFRLNQFVQSQPYLIAQLVALINTQHQVKILRQTLLLTFDWSDKLENYYYDYPQGILDALKIEAYLIGSPFVFSQEFLNNPIAQFIQKPYVQFMAQDISNRMFETYSSLEDENICSFDLTSRELVFINVPWWNTLGQIATPNFSEQWLRANWLMLDIELTQNVLKTESIRQREKDSLDSLSNSNSQICPNKLWKYKYVDGEFIVHLSPDYFSDKNYTNSFIQPLKFRWK